MNSFDHVSQLKITAARNSSGRTVMTDSFFTSPFKIMKPFQRPDGGITVYQQTASAGILAGDSQEHSFNIEENATLELVSQSFEKIFKMEDGGSASRSIAAKVGKGATLIYSPLPCMPFAGSDFRSQTKIQLQDDSSKLIYIDTICGGRKAHGELFDYRRFSSLVQVTKMVSSVSGIAKPELIYRDNTVFEGSDCGQHPEKKAFMMSPAMYGEYSHLGTMLLFGFNLKPADLFESLELPAKLLYTAENINSMKNEPLVALTQTSGNGIAIRILGNSAEEVQKILGKVKNSI